MISKESQTFNAIILKEQVLLHYDAYSSDIGHYYKIYNSHAFVF